MLQKYVKSKKISVTQLIKNWLKSLLKWTSKNSK
jgi:hypothetical protein